MPLRGWATISTLITTAKLNDVEPQAWLTDILQRLTDGHPQSYWRRARPWTYRQ
jgi:hypothetical protein